VFPCARILDHQVAYNGHKKEQRLPVPEIEENGKGKEKQEINDCER